MNKTSYDKSVKFTASVPGRAYSDISARIKVSETDEDQKILVIKVAPAAGIRDLDGELQKPGDYKDLGGFTIKENLPKICDASRTTVMVQDGVLLVTVPKFDKFVGSALTVTGPAEVEAPVVETQEA